MRCVMNDIISYLSQSVTFQRPNILQHFISIRWQRAAQTIFISRVFSFILPSVSLKRSKRCNTGKKLKNRNNSDWRDDKQTDCVYIIVCTFTFFETNPNPIVFAHLFSLGFEDNGWINRKLYEKSQFLVFELKEKVRIEKDQLTNP